MIATEQWLEITVAHYMSLLSLLLYVHQMNELA